MNNRYIINLLEEMKRNCLNGNNYYDPKRNDKVEALNYAIFCVERQQPTVDAEPVRKWISVNDRLPEGGEDVLVTIPFKNTWIYYVAYVESGKWYVPTMYGRSNVPDITHWMPLPETPKEEQDG